MSDKQVKTMRVQCQQEFFKLTGLSVRVTEIDEKKIRIGIFACRSEVWAFQGEAISAVLTEQPDSIAQ